MWLERVRMSALWHIRGGPKNGGRFGRMRGHRFEIGLNHRPMTKAARMRFLRASDEAFRRAGYWR